MTRKAFNVEAPILRLTIAEYQAIPDGRPLMVVEQPRGTRWREICWGGIRIREMIGVGSDGVLLATYKPVIRVPAVTRLMPRQEVRS